MSPPPPVPPPAAHPDQALVIVDAYTIALLHSDGREGGGEREGVTRAGHGAKGAEVTLPAVVFCASPVSSSSTRRRMDDIDSLLDELDEAIDGPNPRCACAWV